MKKLWLILIVLLVAIAGAWLYLQQNPEMTLSLVRDMERSRAGLEQKEIIVDGEAWPYLEGGPADAETIVLLHGFGGEKDHWTRFAAELTDRYHVIAPDLPGFGESPRHSDWVYDMPAQMPRLDDFLVAKGLELQQFHMAGNSMGGNLAAYYAANYSHRILSLALLDTSGVSTVEPSFMDQARERGENPLLVESVEDFDRMLGILFVNPPPMPEALKAYFAEKSVANRDFNAMIYEQYGPNRRGWLEQYLPSIEDLPVLLLWGEEDQITHVSSIERITPLLNNESVVVMPGVGHVPMLERPEETAAHYLKFIERARYPTPEELLPVATDPSEPAG